MSETEQVLQPTIALTHSEQMNELFGAMAKAQAEITDAEKDSTNPFFKSKYADLASVRAACVPSMAKQGICITQWWFAASKSVTIVTILGHSSGQFIRADSTLMAKADDAQSVGSAITYGRRYSLMAAAGVAASEEDDDGNAATRPPATPEHKKNMATAKAAVDAGKEEAAKQVEHVNYAQMMQHIKDVGAKSEAEADKVIAALKPGATRAACWKDEALSRAVFDSLDARCAVGDTFADIYAAAIGKTETVAA